MSHEIDRILAACAGSTWAIEEAKAAEIATLLMLRADGTPRNWAEEPREAVYAADPVPGRTGPVHVLQLHGTVMPRGGMMTRMSGGASLEQFGKAFAAAADDPSAQAIVLNIDSPGGMVDLVAETQEAIFAARRANRPIIAVANTLAASAAYWIASAADEIVVTPSGKVGSIGVLGQHDDMSKRFEMMGVTRQIISSGPRKAEGVHGPLDESARKHRQASADYAYDMFTKAVARNRSVPVSTVKADPETSEAHFGGGRAYNAREAVRLGMADRIDTFDATLKRVAAGRRHSTRASLARARLAMS